MIHKPYMHKPERSSKSSGTQVVLSRSSRPILQSSYPRYVGAVLRTDLCRPIDSAAPSRATSCGEGARGLPGALGIGIWGSM
jgi:hypothetical protein